MSASSTYPRIAGGIIGYAVGYALPVEAGLRHWHYDPIARTWLWTANSGGVPMGYLGLVTAGLVGAVIGIALGPLVAKVEVARRLLGPWALGVLGIVGAFFAWHNWP